MSYSQTFSGTKAAILVAIAAFAGTQKTQDEAHGASQGVIDGHQQQIACTESIVKAALADPAIADDAQISVGVHGHADDKGEGSYGFNVSSIPVVATPKTE